jgi:hypothetical protein
MENINKNYLIEKGFEQKIMNKVGELVVYIYVLNYQPPYKSELANYELSVFFGNELPIVRVNSTIITYIQSKEQFEHLFKGLMN